jgi:hypothetical protein
MTKKPKTAMQKLKDYLEDRRYRLANMHEDDVEDLEEQKGVAYVSMSIEIISELLLKIKQLERCE